MRKVKRRVTPDQRWANDSIQFPRLLAEIIGVGLSEGQWDALLETMDLESDDLNELFDRAQVKWEKQKASVIKIVRRRSDG